MSMIAHPSKKFWFRPFVFRFRDHMTRFQSHRIDIYIYIYMNLEIASVLTVLLTIIGYEYTFVLIPLNIASQVFHKKKLAKSNTFEET